MKGQRLAVLVVAILMLAGSGQAQEEDRLRFSLPDKAPSTADLKSLLNRRQSLGRDEEQVRKLVQNMLKGNFDAQLLKQLQEQLQQNPELKQQIESRLLSQPDLRKQVESILKQPRPNPEQLRDLATKLTPQHLPDPPPIGPETPPMLPNPVVPPPVTNPPTPVMPPEGQRPEPPQPMPMPMPLAPQPQQEATPDWFRKQATEWASTWTKGIRNLDNDTLKGIVEQIQRTGLASTKLELPEWIKSSTKDFSGDLKNWMPNLGGMPTGLRDTLGQIRAPNLGGNWNMGTPELPTAESAGQSLGVFLALIVVGFSLWVLWMTRGLGYFAAPDEGTARRHLGPWPVAPDTVTTRSQLVQCFEYLARRLLGMPAETSHHHEVARQMGNLARNPQQQRAAEDLAELYEQARYTPPSETLAPDELARARQALGLLGRVNPA